VCVCACVYACVCVFFCHFLFSRTYIQVPVSWSAAVLQLLLPPLLQLLRRQRRL
jgi:hypothetical protein